jgi:hypothetical protein
VDSVAPAKQLLPSPPIGEKRLTSTGVPPTATSLKVSLYPP